jgi:RHS repeat-associated protein
MQARYTHGPGIDQPLMMERGGQVYFYHLDGQFNVAQLTDASGNSVCSYSYDSFGRTQLCQNVANPYGFAGREYDAESGLYYMRARYYDPSLGRFLSADPLDLTNLLLTAQDNRAGLVLLPASSGALVKYAGMGALGSPQQLNPYSYALNNPAAFRDPSGLKCHGPGPVQAIVDWYWKIQHDKFEGTGDNGQDLRLLKREYERLHDRLGPGFSLPKLGLEIRYWWQGVEIKFGIRSPIIDNPWNTAIEG